MKIMITASIFDTETGDTIVLDEEVNQVLLCTMTRRKTGVESGTEMQVISRGAARALDMGRQAGKILTEHMDAIRQITKDDPMQALIEIEKFDRGYKEMLDENLKDLKRTGGRNA